MKFPLILFPFLPHALADFNGLRKLGNDKCDKDGDGLLNRCAGVRLRAEVGLAIW